MLKKGYAEADPSFDIDGIDAAHKTIILSGLAYGKMLSLNDLSIKGIRNITLNDITYCIELGYKIKLLGNSEIVSNIDGDEELFCSVEPWLIPKDYGLSSVSNVTNAVQVKSSLVGTGNGYRSRCRRSQPLLLFLQIYLISLTKVRFIHLVDRQMK